MATEAVLARDKGPFAAPQTQLESVRVDSGMTTPDLTNGRGRAMLLAKEGACDHLQITGQCPTSPGQALILAGDAEYSGLEIGDPVDLTGGLPNVTIVGTYTVPGDRDRLLVRPAPAGQRAPSHRRHQRRRRAVPAGTR